MDVSLVLLVLGVFWFPVILGLEVSPTANLTNSTNDMYVIHATVYQVGIITNKSDDEIANMTGNQEALSFYHSDGSAVDLSAIPAPLMTNLTAQSAVALAPVGPPGQPGAATVTSETGAPLAEVGPFASGEKSLTVKRSDGSVQPILREDDKTEKPGKQKRDVYASLFRRSTGNSSNGPTIKVVKETSLIPPEVGLKSIGLPDLVGLNTGLTSVPLPIPNTSVVEEKVRDGDLKEATRLLLCNDTLAPDTPETTAALESNTPQAHSPK